MDSFSSLKGRILLNRFCPSIRAFHCIERDFLYFPERNREKSSNATHDIRNRGRTIPSFSL